jgi:hypothetical protein
MMGMPEDAHEGDHGMMQHCMEMMNSMMGSDAMNASNTAAMGSNLPLSLMVALVLAVALGYLLGAARRTRAQA